MGVAFTVGTGVVVGCAVLVLVGVAEGTRRAMVSGVENTYVVGVFPTGIFVGKIVS